VATPDGSAHTVKSGNTSRQVITLSIQYIIREGYDIETLRVSGNSRPNSVAGAIAALLRSEQEVEVQAIGPQAVNQAVKAIAIARSYIELDGLDLTTQPSFVKLELHEEERTAVRFSVRAQPLESR
jgi:stage V sporulation protein S